MSLRLSPILETVSISMEDNAQLYELEEEVVETSDFYEALEAVCYLIYKPLPTSANALFHNLEWNVIYGGARNTNL